MCWAIWISRNDIVFDKSIVPSYLLFRGDALDSVLVTAS
jgi:hypothetical protein